MSFFKKDPIQITTFRSYGTTNHLYAKGRALEDENIDLSKKGFFNLIYTAYKRFRTHLIKNEPLILTLPNGEQIETKTDNQGYYLVDQQIENLGNLADAEGCIKYVISFADVVSNERIKGNNDFKGEIAIPSETVVFGIISDVDDTIMQTGLTSRFKWQVLKNTIFKRAEKRIPLEGAAAFYEKLKNGKSGNENNPVFYVSHGPWNLYLYLQFFLRKNNFPKGAILLRDFVNPFTKRFKPKPSISEKPQKQKEILNIMKTYPQLPFILIGDSGEHDPDIYMEIAEAHPERINAIYLRSVNHAEKMLRVKGLLKDYETVPMLLVEDSKEALKHAHKMGFI